MSGEYGAAARGDADRPAGAPRGGHTVAGQPLEAARASGLIAAGEPLLVLLSGGADSVCLLDVALALGARASALHVNYGLRAEAEQDEEHCRVLCARLDVELAIERARLPARGNLQAHARDARYHFAQRLASGDYAAGHTASDQAETVLYRLATSPGRRALLGMAPRRGRLVRPLLEVTREEVRGYCAERRLEWREDASNADPRFARTRVRAELLSALRAVAPAPERTIAETAAGLREEDELLEVATADALALLGGGPAVELAALRALAPALARLVLRELAERATGGARSLSRRQAAAVLALGEAAVGPGAGTSGQARGGTRELDLGEGLRAVAEYGTLRLRHGAGAPEPEPVDLAVPGRVRFGAWDVEAAPGGTGEVAVSAAALGGALRVRAWREGDRMRPLGLDGTKTLQDLFTDAKVPRALRRCLPIVVTGDDRVVWVARVALDERFAAREGDERALGLSARRVVE
jgi:tRNA(Ile)-lysidine synthase